MKSKTKLMIASILTVSLLAVPAMAHAHEGDDNREFRGGRVLQDRDEAQGNREENIQERLEQRAERRCDQVDNRIEERKIRLGERMERRAKIYEKHDQRIKELLEGAKDKGIDTTKAESDLVEWKKITDELRSARQKLLEELDDTNQAHCDENQDLFKSSLESAKKQLEEVKTIHNRKIEFFKGTLLPDLKEIKKQLEENLQ